MEERDIMEVDVLFVGGGVACLSGALHLANQIKKAGLTDVVKPLLSV